MNAEPFEHAMPTLILIEPFYGNPVKISDQRLRCLLPQSHGERACICLIERTLFLPDHHGHYSIYDAYLCQLCRNKIQVYYYHVHRCSCVCRCDIDILGRALSAGSPLDTR